jgi:hypothetical protein
VGVEIEAGFDDSRTLEVAEVGVWIKYPSFDLYLADQLAIIDDPTAEDVSSRAPGTARRDRRR